MESLGNYAAFDSDCVEVMSRCRVSLRSPKSDILANQAAGMIFPRGGIVGWPVGTLPRRPF